MVPVLGVEAAVLDEVEAAADHVVGGEGRPVGLAGAGAAEAVPVVAVVTVRLLVPPRQPVHADVLRGQADPHVAVAAFAHDLDLEVVEAARGWYGVRSPD